jgi:hypothetical protein
MTTATSTETVFRRKPAYSPGDIAGLFGGGVAATTIRHALDSGVIPGGYRHPGSAKHRRITDKDLEAYLKADPSLAEILARFNAAPRPN